jgi:Domain of unknown function (4846)
MRYLLLYATILPILFPLNFHLPGVANKQLAYRLLLQDIPPPAGFTRRSVGKGSFAEWLRQVNLKKNNTVYLFNGLPKTNQQAQFAVLDIPVGNKNLQQCADAVMRLRAEYLYSAGRYNEIVFYDNLNRAYRFDAANYKTGFESYLEKVYTWCGTLSLDKQLKIISNYADVQPGDVFIHGGSPGHAVIVMDVAVNLSGEQVFLLAQSYMPAQDIHILKNPADEKQSPWYSLPANGPLQTPEWIFKQGERKRW